MAYLDNVTNILQIQPDGLPTFVRLSQNENGRNLYFQLAGNEIDIPSNSTVTISGTKPDGTVYSATGSISDNVVLIPEMVQMTAVAGTWDAKIRITSGGNTVATGRVRFIVDADTVEPGSVPSDSELEGLVAEAQQYAETARTEAYGSPLTATTAAGMTDKTRVYVYTGSETGYTAGHWYFWDGSAWTDGGAYNAVAVNTDTTLTLSGVPADAKATGDAIDSLKNDLDNLTDAFNVKKYGVSGVGQSANQLTRILDAVGMVAEVGTDGDNSAVRNDFDSAAPWKWRKCVGHWTKGEDRGIFRVRAYQGDADYTEDGTNGDYVAVECPISYYKMDGDQLIISAHQHEGFRPFDIFCHDHNPQDTIPYYYRPAYALALKDGKAVSLPGLDNCQGAYKTIMDDARTYDGGALGGLAITYPMALSFYDWAMFTVEFAAQNCQSIMQGCAGLRHNANDRLTFKDATHVLVSNWQVSRVVGEYIAIVPTNVDINAWTVSATHKIIGVTRCNADGTASTSGAYTLLEITDLGKAYYEYDITGGTEYRICGRPYRTGECNSVSTPSGSPVSNSDSYHPMKYRWVENLYSNQYKTVADFFNKQVGTDDSDYYLEHYYLLRPQDYVPSTTSKPDTTDLATDKFEKILETPHVNYVNGYVKSKKYSDEYPDIWIPGETTGASTSTYFADQAYLVDSSAVRSVRLYGAYYNGASDGLSYFLGNTAPSNAYAHYGGGLCVIQ